MKAFLAVLIAIALSACATAPDDRAARSQDNAATDDIVPITIGETRMIASVALGARRTYNVWLPPGYDASRQRYPVLYLLDGGLAQDFAHIGGLAQYASISALFREMIVVGVETVDRQRELTDPSADPRDVADFPTQGASAQFRAFLTDELTPAVDALYRTSGERALIGESLAGYFVVETFLIAPQSADIYIAISPSLWWNEAKLAASAKTLIPNAGPAPRRLYLAIADEGGAMREGMLALVEALKAAKQPGLAWTFSDRPDLTHATIYHREALEAFVWAFAPPQKTAN